MEKDKYGLIGTFNTQPGKAKELAGILLDAANLMKQAKGCHLYVVGLKPEEQDKVTVSEIWDSREDHDNSLNLPGVRELIGQAMPLLAGAPEKGQELTILGGLGIK